MIARDADAGCGTGEQTILLSWQGFQVFGVDISRQTIDALAAKFPDGQFLRSDIRHLQFEDDLFDAHFFLGSLRAF